MVQGKISSKYQLTLPAEVRKAMGIKPGDKVSYEIVDGTLHVSLVRPPIEAVLDGVLAEFDFSELQNATGGDAVAYVRKLRGEDD